MNRRELTKEEITCLISEFKSEIKKNQAKVEFFNTKIEELTSMLNNIGRVEGADGVVKGGRRIRKIEDKPRKPYPLSKWDVLILDVIKENGRPMLSKDIYSKVLTKAAELGLNSGLDENKQKSKINQCLVKLSGRRTDLVKMKYGGKGYAYCITNVVNKKQS